MSAELPTRDELAERYLAQLPYAPYPVQEDALLAWFTAAQGVLVCAPTGTGKTLIAQAALFEALHSGSIAYYTTPLIALTEQKFQEMQASAVRWGFQADEVGLVTGNRRVNPNARILVVVAEILLNRLLHAHREPDLPDDVPLGPEAFDFTRVSAVVMDEFHNFADLERGIVWELALALLPAHIRLLLLSATVGNAREFLAWLERCHRRKLELVESKDRKIPLTFRWVPDEFLGEQLVQMAKAAGENRTTPALVFCFNRDECWSVAEMLKGLDLLAPGIRGRLNDEVDELDWTKGVGPKLKQMLRRGVGVHHAGLLPKYRRVVEHLFEKKLLSVAVCTETLAAGINLPARSVVLTSLVKGPHGKERLIDASTAHQIFGRAGRPQFDDRGFVFALAHEDDVRILRWREKYDAIPDSTRDPGLIKAKKALKKKKPSRRDNAVYWSESQFQQLQSAPPGKLYSKGPMPWRLLAYLLKLSPEVARLRTVLGKRLMDEARIKASEKALDRMLLTLAERGFVTLDPPLPVAASGPLASPIQPTSEPLPVAASGPLASPIQPTSEPLPVAASGPLASPIQPTSEPLPVAASGPLASPIQPTSEPLPVAASGPLASPIQPTSEPLPVAASGPLASPIQPTSEPLVATPSELPPDYRIVRAVATPALDTLLVFRSVHPLYGAFLVEQLGIADRNERIQALESVLGMPRPLLRYVRVPRPDQLPPGPLAANRLDPELIRRGLILAPVPKSEDDEEEDDEEEERPPTLAEKLGLLFEATHPAVSDVSTQSVWAAGELLRFNGNFNLYVQTRDLVKQEGIVFRHLLRLILLCGEFAQVCPPETTPAEWQADLRDLSERLTASCREVDPASTDEAIQFAHAADVVEGETVTPSEPRP